MGGHREEIFLKVPGLSERKGYVITGERPGKTLVVTAGVHGSEYVGILALKELVNELDPSEMSGRVILFPLLNEYGFHHGLKQAAGTDGVNLNRAFPGDANGSETYRLAAAVERELYPKADFLLDLHSGDTNEIVLSFLFFPAYSGEEVAAAARAAASAMSLPYRVASSAKDGLYSRAAVNGIPALLLERGGLARYSRDEVEADKKNVRELMAHLGILPEKYARPESEPAQREIGRALYSEALKDGFWYPAVREGDRVKKGGLLGELKTLDDELICRYEAEFDGLILYYTTYLGVRAGDPLVTLGDA